MNCKSISQPKLSLNFKKSRTSQKNNKENWNTIFNYKHIFYLSLCSNSLVYFQYFFHKKLEDFFFAHENDQELEGQTIETKFAHTE